MTRVIHKLALGMGMATVCTAAVAAPEAQIAVRPSAEVGAAQITIADVAAVECAQAELKQKIESTQIVASALPGKARQISRDQIIISLRRRGIVDSSVSLLCPNQISVTTRAAAVSGQSLFETARQFVLGAQDWPGTIEVEPVRLPPDQLAPAGKMELRVKSGTQPMRRGRNSVPVEIVVDGQARATTSVAVNVRVFALVTIASQAISKGAEVGPSNIALRNEDVTTMPEDVLIGEIAPGMTATMPIAEGAVLRKGWVADPAAIHSGDTVIVSVTSGSVRVTEKGTAAADARMGERVKVRMSDNTREVRGTVAGPGLVEIVVGRRIQ